MCIILIVRLRFQFRGRRESNSELFSKLIRYRVIFGTHVHSFRWQFYLGRRVQLETCIRHLTLWNKICHFFTFPFRFFPINAYKKHWTVQFDKRKNAILLVNLQRSYLNQIKIISSIFSIRRECHSSDIGFIHFSFIPKFSSNYELLLHMVICLSK